MASSQEIGESATGEPCGVAVLAPGPVERLREMGRALGHEVPRRILELFLEDAGSRLRDLQRSLASGDAPAVERAAHSLKGSSANLGATDFADLCHELERRGGRRELAGTEEGLSALEVEFARVEAAMRRLLAEFSG